MKTLYCKWCDREMPHYSNYNQYCCEICAKLDWENEYINGGKDNEPKIIRLGGRDKFHRSIVGVNLANKYCKC